MVCDTKRTVQPNNRLLSLFLCKTSALLWRLGFFGCTLSSLFTLCHVKETLLLLEIDEFELWHGPRKVLEGELFGIILDHGRASQASTKVLGTSA